jgi:drug/metabolite transporter (DMT)-like permease
MTSTDRPPVPPKLALAVAVAAVSTAALFIKLADAPKLAIAAYRCIFSAVLLGAIGARACAREWPRLTRRELLFALGTGFCLALHFATWISSLSYTSVASSIVIVDTTPLWVALLAPFVSSDRVGRRTLVAMSISFAGVLVIGAGDLEVSPRALLGDGLALIGAWTTALYMLAGRSLRARLSLVPYVTACYGSAAVFLIVFALASGTQMSGFTPRTWGALLALALVPQLIGHSSYNYALRYVPAATAAIVSLGETVGATLLVWLVLGEQPPLATAVGGALVLAGVVLALRGERAST